MSLPKTLKTIGKYALSDCDALNNVVIPESVETVDVAAFQNDSSLKSIVVPDGATVGMAAFRNCTALESAVFPKKMGGMGTEIFSGCKSLKKLTINNTEKVIQFIASNSSLYNCPLEEIFVPASLVDKYKTTADWNKYADIIKPIPSK